MLVPSGRLFNSSNVRNARFFSASLFRIWTWTWHHYTPKTSNPNSSMSSNTWLIYTNWCSNPKPEIYILETHLFQLRGSIHQPPLELHKRLRQKAQKKNSSHYFHPKINQVTGKLIDCETLLQSMKMHLLVDLRGHDEAVWKNENSRCRACALIETEHSSFDTNWRRGERWSWQKP